MRRAARPHTGNWRERVLRDLIRRAEDVEADAIIGLDYSVDSDATRDEAGVLLQRVVATGIAVKLCGCRVTGVLQDPCKGLTVLGTSRLTAEDRTLSADVALAPAPIHPMIALARQFSSYVGIGLGAAGIHYTVLVLLVEFGHVSPVLAALIGYTSGGFLSYGLNRNHTFGSERPHREAVWRFVLVAGVGFALTYVAMFLFVDVMHQPYLAAQVVTTGMTLVWNFSANRFWTFRFER